MAPLTSIKAFAEILLDNQGEDQETQLRFLEIINVEIYQEIHSRRPVSHKFEFSRRRKSFAATK